MGETEAVREAPPARLVMVILVGTPEEIQAGRGRPVLTAAEAAVRLGVSAGRVRQHVVAGELKHVARFERAHLYLETDVEVLRLKRELNQMGT